MKMPEDIKQWLDSAPKPQTFKVESSIKTEDGNWNVTIVQDTLLESNEDHPKQGDVYYSLTSASPAYVRAQDENSLTLVCLRPGTEITEGEIFEYRGQPQPEQV
jgi:hypothetical protein